MDTAKKQGLQKAGINVDSALGHFMDLEAMLEKYLGRFSSDPNFGRLVESLGKGDVEVAHRAAHTLKGISGTLGMDSLHKAALDVEQALKAKDLEKGRSLFPKLEEEYKSTVAALKSLGYGG